MKAHVLCAACAVAVLLAGCATSSPHPAGTASWSPPASSAPGDITPQNEASLYLDIVDGLIKQGRQDAALAFLNSYAMAQKSPEARYWLLRGDALLGSGHPGDAILAYARLERTPLAAAGWNGRGRVAASQARWDEAAGNFTRATQGEPSNADFLNNLAFADLMAGHGDASVACLRQAQQLKPQSELIRNNLIIALALNGDHAGAQAMLAAIPDAAHRAQVQARVQEAIAKDASVMEKKS